MAKTWPCHAGAARGDQPLTGGAICLDTPGHADRACAADQTLGFGGNGLGGGGPILIADLQVGATVTAADILLL